MADKRVSQPDSQDAGAPLAFQVERVDGDGVARLVFTGHITFREASELWHSVRQLLAEKSLPAGGVTFDLARVEAIDGGTLALVLQLESETAARGVATAIAGARGPVAAMLDLYRSARCASDLRSTPVRVGVFDQIGRNAVYVVELGKRVLAYIGDLVTALMGALRSPRTVNWRDLGLLMERTGADGLPIVTLINFLVGLVMGFQAAVQLRQFGANIFVADLVGLTVTREIGPLMTAVVVTGRSGAAFAAEIGTMKVSEEIDALRTLGLCPYRFLVFPRTLALVLVLPMLTLVADLVGMLGGLVVGLLGLDLTFSAYVLQTQERLDLWDVFGGVLKSVFFALAIALIACERGLAATRGAEGVGRSTTSAVVSTLFTLIALDALFTIVFHMFGV
ncbi:MAG: MlaE family lipid ABC transporter permease subunit [Planctomycetota bacterium]